MKNDKGFYDMHQPMSKSQPARVPVRDCNDLGDGHNFNIKGKVTSNAGSDYHDIGRKDSGLNGNFAEKDAAMDYLQNRNKMGQETRHFHGITMASKMMTGGGATAYDSMPIPETYKPATSHGKPPVNAIEYDVTEKSRKAK